MQYTEKKISVYEFRRIKFSVFFGLPSRAFGHQKKIIQGNRFIYSF